MHSVGKRNVIITVICDKLNNGKKCDKVIGRRNTSTTVDWNGILHRMGKCSNFEDLKRYVINLKMRSLPSKFEKNKQLDSDRRDALAYQFLSSDVGVNRGQLFPVASSGGGSCFYYSLSRLVYGDESHCVEMRVQVVHEGIMNMRLYLDHDYLCQGYHFQCGSEEDVRWIYASFCSFYKDGMSLDVGSIEQYYKKEIFNLRLFGEYSGVWQFHQAANVVKCCVQSIYPHTDCHTVRNALNRIFLPSSLEGVNCVDAMRIMWTKCTGSSSGFNHFVPVVERNFSLDFGDVNLQELGRISAPMEIEIDLTEEVGYGFVDKESDCISPTKKDCNKSEEIVNNIGEVGELKIKKEGIIHANESDMKIEGNFLCTSCHKFYDARTYVVLFRKNRYNFGCGVVRNVLSKDIQLNSIDGKEYVCRVCDTSLRHLEGPKIPKKCVFGKNRTQ